MPETHRWDPVRRPPARLVRPVPVDPNGRRGPTRGQAAGPRWRRTSHGLYVPASVDDGVPEQRILEQAARLPPEGAVTGWAACLLHGAALLDGRLPDGTTRQPVPLAVGPRARIAPDPGARLSHDRLDDGERTVRRGIPCVTVERAAFDAMRTALDLREAVLAMDMVAAAELTSVLRMRHYGQGRSGWAGVGQVRAALDLASEHSRSPNETRLRLVWVLDAGLPIPEVNRPVLDRGGRLLGVADLLDVAAGVVGEYDGADHRAARRHTRDVAKEDALREHGLEVFRVTALDLPRTDLVVSRMRRSRSRARFLSEDARSWTLVDPSEEPVPTLDEVLELREWRRSVAIRSDPQVS